MAVHRVPGGEPSKFISRPSALLAAVTPDGSSNWMAAGDLEPL